MKRKKKEADLTCIIQADRSWDPLFQWKLVCPVCGFDYVHISTLKCLRNTDETIITKEGTLVKKSSNDMRGFKITLEYCCENLHVGEIILQFHKGSVYLAHNFLLEKK